MQCIASLARLPRATAAAAPPQRVQNAAAGVRHILRQFCPSVHLFVTLAVCVNTAKHMEVFFNTPLGSSHNASFLHQTKLRGEIPTR